MFVVDGISQFFRSTPRGSFSSTPFRFGRYLHRFQRYSRSNSKVVVKRTKSLRFLPTQILRGGVAPKSCICVTFGCRGNRNVRPSKAIFSLRRPTLGANVTFYRGSIPALLHGLLFTAAVIISLTGRDLDGIRGTQTRFSGKPISNRRCRGPIVLKIADKLRLDRRETMR